MPPANVKHAEMTIAVVGNAGAGKRGILGTLRYYIDDEKAAHLNGGHRDDDDDIPVDKDVGHVLDNGIVRRDLTRRKGTLRGASLPPFGAWTENFCTSSEVPPPPSIPHCHRRLMHQQQDQEKTGSGGMGLVESGYNTTEDGGVEEDEKYHFKTQQELNEEARARAKLEVEKRRKRIMGDDDDDDGVKKKKKKHHKNGDGGADDDAITSDKNEDDGDGAGKGSDTTTSRYCFPLKITYGIPNALARVTDSELRKHDGIVVVVDASTWDQDKGSFENIFKCFAFECKTWPTIHKVIMLTKCDKVLAGCTISGGNGAVTKKKDKKKDKTEPSDDSTIIPSTPATIAELHRISLELETLLLETKAMPVRDVGAGGAEEGDTTTKREGAPMLPNGAIFECSAETGVNVVRGFHHLVALIKQGRTQQNTCCVIA